MKITIIGAGSIVFAKNMIGDILLMPELLGCHFALTDISQERLEKIENLANLMIKQLGATATVSATTDRCEAIKDSDYVITTFQAGGLKYYDMDITIPKKYGVDQAVGDTMGVGGVFRALRTIPIVMDICREMEKYCPKALLINYVNPMAMVTWGINHGSSIKCVGLCHSVQGTAANIASYIGIKPEELSYRAAGINHMTWYLSLEHDKKDVYPLLRETLNNPEIVNKDLTKFEIMRYFGHFITESSYHVSEYMPYFRKPMDGEFIGKLAQIDSWLKEWGGYCFPMVSQRQDEFYEKLERQEQGIEPVDIVRSEEYGPNIIRAMETGKEFKFYGNVINNGGLIANLPTNCCVEVPCIADKAGITPCYVGAIPPQLAALNRTNINVQELAVQAAFTGNLDTVVQAVMLDPLTAASVPYDKMKEMVYELYEAQKDILPQFHK